MKRVALLSFASFLFCLGLAVPPANAAEEFQPIVGQEGKDVVWVPSPVSTVRKMLEVAKVTPQDFVMDLGSGDGRNIIEAAKRGARALGVEFNPNMVELSRRSAEKEGVGDKAQFVQGDMYEADISKASVLALFLLPQNLDKLTSKFLALRPGTRIVANHFGVSGWTPDVTERAEGECEPWCNVLLYIVPARVAGKWRLPDGELTLEQNFQVLTGTLANGAATTQVKGRLLGDQVTLDVGGTQYVGRVADDTMSGAVGGAANQSWRAARASQ